MTDNAPLAPLGFRNDLAPEGGCVMGYPMGDDETCGRPTVSDEPGTEAYLWCVAHLPEEATK